MLYRVLALSALVLATAGLFSCQQARVGRATAALDRANDSLAAANAEKAELASKLQLAEGTTQVVTEYVDRVQLVHERGATIVKEVPVYVTATADAACTVPAGFVHIHDAAASGHPPTGPAGDPDAPAAGVTLSAVAETTAANYATCHATAAQVTGLQALVRQLHDALARQASTP
ncbi:hypothetical protein V3O09_12200 [Stenotrophomonas maltophilia]|uniref:Uncharacterized protein n=1 Tax=Stenotrophomonas maltophilia (strain K279a) TaxID=522373 RepID=B2FIY8_STRMK|nr:hypothetical protein [Stenotrophomonas maltophilia]CAQ43917.1 conserved hypothetical protein [Stenotrophomonas maltophilia K279a]